MFQFPGFATYAYGFSARQFGYPGINARLTASPGFSQSSTPFFAFWRQDIPHTPLVAWPHCSCPRRPRRENPARSLKARNLSSSYKRPTIAHRGSVTILFSSLRLAQITQKLLCLTIARQTLLFRATLTQHRFVKDQTALRSQADPRGASPDRCSLCHPRQSLAPAVRMDRVRLLQVVDYQRLTTSS